jgi:DNA-directed RNA polymerase subunit N (RpoN/RPB10)
MLYMKCPTCGLLLGEIQLEYEAKLYQINNNNKLSDADKDEKRMELMNSFGLKDRYCCRSRLISYVDVVQIIR